MFELATVRWSWELWFGGWRVRRTRCAVIRLRWPVLSDKQPSCRSEHNHVSEPAVHVSDRCNAEKPEAVQSEDRCKLIWLESRIQTSPSTCSCTVVEGDKVNSPQFEVFYVTLYFNSSTFQREHSTFHSILSNLTALDILLNEIWQRKYNKLIKYNILLKVKTGISKLFALWPLI